MANFDLNSTLDKIFSVPLPIQLAFYSVLEDPTINISKRLQWDNLFQLFSEAYVRLQVQHYSKEFHPSIMVDTNLMDTLDGTQYSTSGLSYRFFVQDRSMEIRSGGNRANQEIDYIFGLHYLDFNILILTEFESAVKDLYRPLQLQDKLYDKLNPLRFHPLLQNWDSYFMPVVMFNDGHRHMKKSRKESNHEMIEYFPLPFSRLQFTEELRYFADTNNIPIVY